MKYQTNEYYHLYNRGVEKRDIFLDLQDYRRFLYILDAFNTVEPDQNAWRGAKRAMAGYPISLKKAREPLLEIQAYCLMPNHYHLVVQQKVKGGISEFLKRIGIGYTHYFNQKYERSGVLFQGKTKHKYVHSQEYFQYLCEYVYLNPVDLVEPGWKEAGIKDINKVLEYLESYPWSSKQDTEELRKYLK